MRILEINSHLSGSTGKIMLDIARVARNEGFEVYTSSAVHRHELRLSENTHIYIGSLIEKKIHNILRWYTGYNSIYSQIGTWFFIKKIKKIKPDIIHLHNLHSCYIDMRQLFSYINKYNIPVIWTLHDCWTFTGHCTYFDVLNCDGWKYNCEHCVNYGEYPATKINRVSEMFKIKKKLFTSGSVKMLITPSRWLANLTRESFWKNTPVHIINNGIDQSVFRPTQSDLRRQFELDNKFIVLGVASPWNYRKAPDTFVKLSKDLDPDRYQIIVIGSSGEEFKDGKNIICIPKINNKKELAAFYTLADVFVNPTREDNFPTVNIEALSCGTPVVTYKTGGSAECIDKNCGIAVERENYGALVKAIMYCREHPFDERNCITSAEKYNLEKQVMEYIKIYKNVKEESECIE